MCRLFRNLPRLGMFAVLALSGCNGSPLNASASTDSPAVATTAGRTPRSDLDSKQTATDRDEAGDSASVNESLGASIVANEANEEMGDAALSHSALDNPVIRDHLAPEIELAGEWTGFAEFFWVTRLIIERNAESDSYRIQFIKSTDLTGNTEFERTAKFENGVLALDKDVCRFELVGSRTPYSVLYTVHTDRGDFLVPAVNTDSIKSVNHLTPGFTYRRMTPDPRSTISLRAPEIVRRESERFFAIADRDENGELSETEFNNTFLIRARFQSAGVRPKFPIARANFFEVYPKSTTTDFAERPEPRSIPDQ